MTGVAEKKSSFSFQMLFISSYRPSGLPLSVIVHTVHPSSCEGLVVASLHGATLMNASSTFVKFSRCF